MSTTFDIITGELIDECETPMPERSSLEDQCAPGYQFMLALQTLGAEARHRANATLPPEVLMLDVERFLKTCN